MAKVFLSYASRDREHARSLYDWLTGQGHEVFFDNDVRDGISLGEEWKRRLYDELGRVDAVVSLLTGAYLASTWCTAEVAIADARGCLVVPLRVEDVTHPLLDDLQHTSADPAVARTQVSFRLRSLDLGGRGSWRDGDNPYPGLLPFTAERSKLYFGRSREVRELVARLRTEAGHGATAVTGPSGCGKSSLVLAGVVPLLTADPDWLVVDPFEPGTDPVYAFAVSLTTTARRLNLAWTLGEVRHRLAGGGARELVDELRIACAARHALVVLDQAEALFSPDLALEDRTGFADLLSGIVGRVRLLATIRSEYLDELGDLPVGRIGTFLLRPLAREMLRAAIEEPARIAGLRLEPELADRLIADTDTTDALPLLAFTLELLAEGRRRAEVLTVAAYDALTVRHGFTGVSGLHAVLASQASSALSVAARGLGEAEVLANLVRLVSVDRTDRWTRRPVKMTSLGKPLREALSVFVTHRLLIADGDIVQFAHEALCTAWPPLAAAIQRQGAALRAARAAEQAGIEWVDAKRTDGYLWDEERYSTTVRELSDAAVRLDSTGTAFLEATKARITLGRRRERVRRTRTVTVLSSLLVVLLVVGAVALVQAGQAQDERDAARIDEIIARADGVRAADPQQSLRLALAAHDLAPGTETEAALARTLSHDRYAATVRGHASTVFSAAFSPNQRLLATGDGNDHQVRLWDVSDLSHPRQVGSPRSDHSDWVLATAFSPDGRLLVTASPKEMILWNVESPENLRKVDTIGAHDPDGRADKLGIAFSPDGSRLASTHGGFLTLWDMSTPEHPVRVPTVEEGLRNSFSDVAFSPDGDQIAVVRVRPGIEPDVAGDLLLWDLTNPATPRRHQLATSTNPFTSVAYAPGQDHALVTSTGGYSAKEAPKVQLWSTTNPAAASPLGDPLPGVGAGVRDVAVSPDGRTVAAAGLDDAVHLWDVSNPLRPQPADNPITDHTNDVYTVSFRGDGAMVTGGADDNAILWAPDLPTQPVLRKGPALDVDNDVLDLALTEDGRALAVAAPSGMTWLWDLANAESPRGPSYVKAARGLTTTLAFRPDGRFLATGTSESGQNLDEQVDLWDVGKILSPTRAGPPLYGLRDNIATLRYSAGGDRLWAASVDVTLRGWDVTSPANPATTAEAMDTRADNSTLVAFRADGAAVASRDSKDPEVIVIRDITDPDNVVLLEQPIRHAARDLAFVSNGNVLVTGGADVLRWDVSTAWQPRQLGSPLGVGDDVAALAVSGDGGILAVGQDDGTLTVWDISDPLRPHRIGGLLTEHHSAVTELALSRDGRTLASGDSSGHVRLWNLAPYIELRGRTTALACERAGRGFNEDEWIRNVGSTFEFRNTCP